MGAISDGDVIKGDVGQDTFFVHQGDPVADVDYAAEVDARRKARNDILECEPHHGCGDGRKRDQGKRIHIQNRPKKDETGQREADEKYDQAENPRDVLFLLLDEVVFYEEQVQGLQGDEGHHQVGDEGQPCLGLMGHLCDKAFCREFQQENEQDRGEATCVESEPGRLLADRSEVHQKPDDHQAKDRGQAHTVSQVPLEIIRRRLRPVFVVTTEG